MRTTPAPFGLRETGASRGEAEWAGVLLHGRERTKKEMVQQGVVQHLPDAAASEAVSPPDSQEIAPVEQIYGVSRPQCIDCRAFAQTMARAYDATIIVTGPEASRISGLFCRIFESSSHLRS